MCRASRSAPPCSASPGRCRSALAPTGLTGFFHRDGEIEAARAAQAAGVPFTLSTMSICSIEDVRAAVEGNVLVPALSHARSRLQRGADRARTRGALLRAHAHARSALAGAAPARSEERAVRAAATDARRMRWEILMRPRWLTGVLLGQRRTLGNLAAFFPERGIGELSEWVGGQFDPSITWKDVAWVRERWPGKLDRQGNPRRRGRAARGRCRRRCHRRLQSRRPAARWRHLDDRRLPRVVDAVAGRCEVLLDGGVTSGQDVLKALALGARACLIGKAFLYGLAARGGEGVSLALEIIRRNSKSAWLCAA